MLLAAGFFGLGLPELCVLFAIGFGFLLAILAIGGAIWYFANRAKNERSETPPPSKLDPPAGQPFRPCN